MNETERRRTGKVVTMALGVAGAFVMSFVLGSSFARRADGATTSTGYLFNTSNVSISDCTTNYGSAISSTVNDYDDNTDLSVSLVPLSCTLITYTQGDYGNTPWHAVAIARNSSGDACADFSSGTTNGNCNKTTKKAASGTIYFNDYHGIFASSKKNWAARHELGHIFGMGHVTSCTPNSVMKDPGCSSPPSSLTTSDKNVINGWY